MIRLDQLLDGDEIYKYFDECSARSCQLCGKLFSLEDDDIYDHLEEHTAKELREIGIQK